TVTVVTGSGGYVSGSSNAVGSVFYAHLAPADGQTRIHLLGKPTGDGNETCSDLDADPFLVPDKCSEMVTGVLWPGRVQMTGREEAEVIQGIDIELELAGTAKRPPGKYEAEPPAATAAASSGPTKEPCVRK